MTGDPKIGAELAMAGVAADEIPECAARVVSAWARTDTRGAEDWIAKQGGGPEYDQAREALASTISYSNPSHAMEKAKTIINPELRLKAVGKVFERWQRRNPAAANKALGRAGLTAEQIESIRGPSPE